MSRFLRTPIIPLVLIVAVVFLGFQAFSRPFESAEELTYSELIGTVRTSPQSIEQIVFKPKSRGLKIAFTDGSKANVNYATEEAQVEFQQLLESQGVAFDSEGSGRSAWTAAPVHPAVHPLPRALVLPHLANAGGRIEGHELRQVEGQAHDC